MISGIIGAAGAVAGTALSALGGARAAREKRRELANRERENNAWYDQRYKELGVERADAQAALSAMRAASAQRMASARGTSAVMGASAGSVAAEKSAANQAMGQTIGAINASAEQYKQGIESTYLGEKRAISNARYQAAEDSAKQWAAAGSQLSSMGGSIMKSNAFDK